MHNSPARPNELAPLSHAGTDISATAPTAIPVPVSGGSSYSFSSGVIAPLPPAPPASTALRGINPCTNRTAAATVRQLFSGGGGSSCGGEGVGVLSSQVGGSSASEYTGPLCLAGLREQREHREQLSGWEASSGSVDWSDGGNSDWPTVAARCCPPSAFLSIEAERLGSGRRESDSDRHTSSSGLPPIPRSELESERPQTDRSWTGSDPGASQLTSPRTPPQRPSTPSEDVVQAERSASTPPT